MEEEKKFDGVLLNHPFHQRYNQGSDVSACQEMMTQLTIQSK